MVYVHMHTQVMCGVCTHAHTGNVWCITLMYMHTYSGNEGHGVHRELEVECDAILTVTPHRQLSIGLDSLNVAVATGILLHTLQRTSPINTKMTQTIQ